MTVKKKKKEKLNMQILNVTLLQAFNIVMKTEVPDREGRGARPNYSINTHTGCVNERPLWPTLDTVKVSAVHLPFHT